MSDRNKPYPGRAFRRYLSRRAGRSLRPQRRIVERAAMLEDLRAEIDLLTTYSTDVIYRLRYDTMEYDYISPSVERLLGYSVDEFRRINLRDMIVETRMVTEDLRPLQSYDALEATRRRGATQEWQADYLIETKRGHSIWVSDISYPWFSKQGDIIGSVGSLRDISRRVDAERTLQEEMVRMAHTDMLTGMANRRAFFERLNDELRRTKRSREQLSLCLIDVDHLKKINERYGHEVGDKVLQGISKIIRECLRETDLGARIGGQEFGLVLPDTSQEGAFWVADRIRDAVAKHTFFVDDKFSRPVGCTVSVGISGASYSQDVDSTTLYKLADSRLYIAKHTGRNQVSVDELVNMH